MSRINAISGLVQFTEKEAAEIKCTPKLFTAKYQERTSYGKAECEWLARILGTLNTNGEVFYASTWRTIVNIYEGGKINFWKLKLVNKKGLVGKFLRWIGLGRLSLVPKNDDGCNIHSSRIFGLGMKETSRIGRDPATIVRGMHLLLEHGFVDIMELEGQDVIFPTDKYFQHMMPATS
ncbi:hypothetical protein HN858_00695 [Candidatus Falkowbacteria bacterium]|jgi:hypothetical protein|nr:hypothetical protein [Candidatus Falkowbacteria bacterium]MBT5503269.1 hypothetical protein [Candidatus Falkowbacteria bacterium]MBT6574268.1 hypothetical protein [Candidatus Falkowbacteria bacterium]MBT7348172.1 hypothetical protein [Candidatus Falkowbacteria bacterium]MBT7500767.1 hypothetical protein [Candidatus Falkowbacteria bacterium]